MGVTQQKLSQGQAWGSAGVGGQARSWLYLGSSLLKYLFGCTAS